MSQQLPLPHVPVGTPRRRTRHTWGTPSGMYATAQCRSCTVLRRFGPFGSKAGYRFQWSLDGKEWRDAEIPCAEKRSG